jgi:hypothetical protein
MKVILQINVIFLKKKRKGVERQILIYISIKGDLKQKQKQNKCNV